MAEILVNSKPQGGKCYYVDTKNLEFIADVQKRFRVDNGGYSGFWCKLYADKDRLGRPKYILIRRMNYDYYTGLVISESEAKALLARYRYDIFIKRFGLMEVGA